jgi:hypothetical protein
VHPFSKIRPWTTALRRRVAAMPHHRPYSRASWRSSPARGRRSSPFHPFARHASLLSPFSSAIAAVPPRRAAPPPPRHFLIQRAHSSALPYSTSSTNQRPVRAMVRRESALPPPFLLAGALLSSARHTHAARGLFLLASVALEHHR